MKIEKSTVGTDAYLVMFDKNELITDSGRAVPYPAHAGTIKLGKGGRVVYNVWTPAAYVPRGYKSAARRFLEEAALKTFGKM